MPLKPPGIFWWMASFFSYIPTPSSDRVCSNHWSLTSSGTPVVKHSAPNLCEQGSQCEAHCGLQRHGWWWWWTWVQCLDYFKDFLFSFFYAIGWWSPCQPTQDHSFDLISTLNWPRPLKLQLLSNWIMRNPGYSALWGSYTQGTKSQDISTASFFFYCPPTFWKFNTTSFEWKLCSLTSFLLWLPCI